MLQRCEVDGYDGKPTRRILSTLAAIFALASTQICTGLVPPISVLMGPFRAIGIGLDPDGLEEPERGPSMYLWAGEQVIKGWLRGGRWRSVREISMLLILGEHVRYLCYCLVSGAALVNRLYFLAGGKVCDICIIFWVLGVLVDRPSFLVVEKVYNICTSI
jgi:hypothetical protein